VGLENRLQRFTDRLMHWPPPHRGGGLT